MFSQNYLKQKVAEAALDYLKQETIIGVGTGSTINYFIDCLATMRHQLEGCVASSVATAARLKACGIPVIDLSFADPLPVYVDGADEVNATGMMIKGGGGALTREKIIAHAAQQFICLVDHTKWVANLGDFPIAVEVLPIARSLVGRALVELGGQPVYRDGFVTDNGHFILDVYHLPLKDPLLLESQIKQIPGVIESGIFAKRRADLVLLAEKTGEISALHPNFDPFQ